MIYIGFESSFAPNINQNKNKILNFTFLYAMNSFYHVNKKIFYL